MRLSESTGHLERLAWANFRFCDATRDASLYAYEYAIVVGHIWNSFTTFNTILQSPRRSMGKSKAILISIFTYCFNDPN
jgi:hypothetical protein